MTQRIQVSVVVPTYKRVPLLRNCLHALVKQDFPRDAYEIIVVDDAGTEETRSLVETFSGADKEEKTGPVLTSGSEAGPCPQVVYANATQTQGPAGARNVGWRMARGEVIAFTDDDCLPEPGWLREGLAALEDDLAGVSGQMVVPISCDPTDYEMTVARLEQSEFVTANCFYRRTALEAAGGFDERFTMAWREDADLQFRMLVLSYKLGYAPAAKVIHPVRAAPWGVSIREQHKSRFNALLFKKYPDLYRSRIQPLPPYRYYGIVLSTVGFGAALLIDQRWLAFGMVAVWAGLILHFTFQRLRNTKHSLRHILEMLFTSILIPYLSIFWRIVGALQYRVWFF